MLEKSEYLCSNALNEGKDTEDYKQKSNTSIISEENVSTGSISWSVYW